jgi:AcrR family transcriptional regulator
MPDDAAGTLTQARRRVLKAPAVRRAELIDCAQALFLAKGYERTTINDVIAATGLSKGAFYHHFRAKEDLLEAIAARYSAQALAQASLVTADPALNALQQINALMAMSREWKAENMGRLRAMFTTLLAPRNAALYHRILGAVFEVMAPALASIIAAGVAEGVFDTPDPGLAAEAILGFADGRRSLVVDALNRADAGDLDGAVAMIIGRVRSEEALIDRLLGLGAPGVDLIGSPAEARALIEAWIAPPGE